MINRWTSVRANGLEQSIRDATLPFIAGLRGLTVTDSDAADLPDLETPLEDLLPEVPDELPELDVPAGAEDVSDMFPDIPEPGDTELDPSDVGHVDL